MMEQVADRVVFKKHVACWWSLGLDRPMVYLGRDMDRWRGKLEWVGKDTLKYSTC